MPNKPTDSDDLDAKPVRRTFTPEFKARILAEYDASSTSLSEARSCGGSACTDRTFWTGVRPGMRVPRRVWSIGASRLNGSRSQASQSNLPGYDARTPGWRPSWPRPAPRWRSWEKRTRCWICSPAARSPRRCHSRSRRSVGCPDPAVGYREGVPADWPVPRHRVPSAQPSRAPAGPAAAAAAQRVEPGRTAVRAGVAQPAALCGPGPGPGLGGAGLAVWLGGAGLAVWLGGAGLAVRLGGAGLAVRLGGAGLAVRLGIREPARSAKARVSRDPEARRWRGIGRRRVVCAVGG
jgi:hypothetical protein